MTISPSRIPAEHEPASAVGAPEVALEILGALQEIRFGSLEVVVHDGKVVQIERTEKFRFANDARRKD